MCVGLSWHVNELTQSTSHFQHLTLYFIILQEIVFLYCARATLKNSVTECNTNMFDIKQ